MKTWKNIMLKQHKKIDNENSIKECNMCGKTILKKSVTINDHSTTFTNKRSNHNRSNILLNECVKKKIQYTQLDGKVLVKYWISKKKHIIILISNKFFRNNYQNKIKSTKCKMIKIKK